MAWRGGTVGDAAAIVDRVRGAASTARAGVSYRQQLRPLGATAEV